MTGPNKESSDNKFPNNPDAKSWECLAITLDPQGTRYRTFLKNNKHLSVKAFRGVKGINLSKEEIIDQGLATKELTMSTLFKYGLIGNAASHRAIWANIAKQQKCYLVLEDDCYTHPRITDFIAENLAHLMEADICFFGINTDSILLSIGPTGLTTLSIFEPKHPGHEWIEAALAKTKTDRVELHQLLKAFGFCAYFISPNGARRLSEKLFPLSLKTTNIPLITDRMPATSIDRAACRIYPDIKAYICHPFLAYTPNIESDTTT